MAGGEGFFLAHWLSYEKLNLCILCGTVYNLSEICPYRRNAFRHNIIENS